MVFGETSQEIISENLNDDTIFSTRQFEGKTISADLVQKTQNLAEIFPEEKNNPPDIIISENSAETITEKIKSSPDDEPVWRRKYEEELAKQREKF